MKNIISFFKRKEIVFATIFLIFGLIFVFITPPIFTLDESTHLYRAYQVSELNLIPDNVGVEAGGTIPTNLGKFVDVSIVGPVQESTWDINLSPSEQKGTVTFTNEAIYPFINYIPQALGLKFGRLITPSVLAQFYIARIFNLLFLAICLVCAIRILPRGKKALIAIGLLPMTIYAGASLSPDVFVLASVALYVAYLFKLLDTKNISAKQWVIMACLAVAVVLSKQTYFILTISVLSLGFRYGKLDKKMLLRAFLVLFIALTVFVSYLLITRGLNTQPLALQHAVGVSANPSEQISLMIHQPLAFFRASIETLQNPTIIPNFFGNFGISDIPLPTYAVFLSFLLLFLSFGSNSKHKTILSSRLVTLLFIVVAALNILIIFVGLYVFWANPRQPYVGGFQSRYLIPILISLLPILIGRLRHNIKWRYILAGQVLVLIVSVATIASHFYA